MDREDKQRFKVLDMVNQNYLTLREATELLHLSYRQIRRMYRRFREQGECALAHGLKGKPSNRRIDTGIREKILSFYEENYSDTSLAFFMKKLACLGYEVNRETLRRWLIAEGFWRGRHKPDISYPKNGKKTNFGELLCRDPYLLLS